jgi:hypothetical protein
VAGCRCQEDAREPGGRRCGGRQGGCDLDAAVAGLYRLPLAEFVVTRDRLPGSCGPPAAGRRLVAWPPDGSLRSASGRPTQLAAAAPNTLAELLEPGAALVRVQQDALAGKPDAARALRRAAAQQRPAIVRLTQRAETLLVRAGQAASDATLARLPATVLHTDGHLAYVSVAPSMRGHAWVGHKRGDYVRDGVSTNLAEMVTVQVPGTGVSQLRPSADTRLGSAEATDFPARPDSGVSVKASRLACLGPPRCRRRWPGPGATTSSPRPARHGPGTGPRSTSAAGRHRPRPSRR